MGDNKFQLISGSAAHKAEINGITIEIIPGTVSPLPVDVRVFEEDTHLVLTVDPVMRYTDEHPIRLMTRILEAKPITPGSVVTKDSSWYAVIHDLDADPICRSEWIDSAYRESLKLAEEHGVKLLGLPLLGTVHGRYSPRDSLLLLIKQVRSQKLTKTKKIMILSQKGVGDEIQKLLARLSIS